MALKGVRVLELAGLAPAPFCGMLLADFGATVTKIDAMNKASVEVLGAGKESIRLDLKHDKGKEVFRKLCAASDVLIEPFRAGTMERLGLGPDDILTINPRLIYARLTGFGQSGSWAKSAGHDINYVALSGVLSLLGRADQPPTPPLNLLADFAGGGLACAMGVLLALVERASSGRGQVVDAAMTEGVAYLASWVGRSRGVLPLWDAERGRNWLDSGAHFYDTYETRDGRHMAVGAIEPQFYAELLDKMGLEEEAVPQHGDWPAARQVLAERFRERTQAEWCSVFDGSDACVTPVLTLEEAARHPHNVARGAFLRPGEGHGGPTVPQPAPKLSRTPGVSRAAGSPADGYVPGKDTRRVLRELGYSDAQVQRLLDEGVAGVDEIGDLQAKL
ncbi:alpha-methylacyl-CoA racemase [Frankliniella occidentalis]|uniref:Alpha-methylacyl-CoA racemase n=1 Tax=Frankliniella occidentalis TaxID=133901 RepID=A0A6J1T3H0_FRAOC|nr:alpha-methylacyl-CoA racemase [Frankliniella occidentalis]